MILVNYREDSFSMVARVAKKKPPAFAEVERLSLEKELQT
jgi:hypothetical protein